MSRLKEMYRIGHSNDTHKFVSGGPLILGGVKIPYDYHLLGHSDADVVYHAISESIIGALGLGDLGGMFPDNDPKYLNIDSSYFMNEVYKIMIKEGYIINNLDVTIYLEKPMLIEYKPLMRENVARLLHVDINSVNIKATRREGLGYIGEMKGITCDAFCLLVKNPMQRL